MEAGYKADSGETARRGEPGVSGRSLLLWLGLMGQTGGLLQEHISRKCVMFGLAQFSSVMTGANRVSQSGVSGGKEGETGRKVESVGGLNGL